MKKVLLIMMAILLVAGTAYADERLSLSGQMRAWGISLQNYETWNDDDESDEKAFFMQRFRLAAKITASEGVYGHLRFDFAEDTWGSHNFAGVRYNHESELQVDRAYLEVAKEKYNVKAGQFLYGTGNYIAVDSQATGFSVKYIPKPMLNVTLSWFKLDEGGVSGSAPDQKTDSSDLALGVDTEDTDLYVLNVGLVKEKFSGNLFFATKIDKGGVEDDTQSVIGLQGKTKAGKVNLNCELNYFMGEDDNMNEDYVGTQLYLDANMDIKEGLNAGAFILYAMGTDEVDECQITELSNFGDFLPFSYGLFDKGDYSPFEDAGIDGSPFELDDNAGTMAIAVYGEKMLLKDKLALRCLLGYAAPTEDANTNLDSVILFNAGGLWEFAQDTKLMASVNYTMPSVDGPGAVDDPALGLLAGVKLDF